ncbi:MAG: hypothetical protein EPO20_11325 [Betaproteobacteria bacterium]|nr:MAG: hypothetical protein EPO20_11325 [Betaproteobacteria bacterium]
MEIACIVRCVGVAVLAVSLQAGAQPPDGKGRPEHAGASPFIRFPVPQRSVGVIHPTELKASAAVPSPRAKVASGEVIEISSPKAVDARAVRAAHTSFAVPAEPPATETKGALRECGAR